MGQNSKKQERLNYILQKIDFRKFSEFALLRNILVHEYLDVKWKKIEKFIKEAEKLYPVFIEKVKELISRSAEH